MVAMNASCRVAQMLVLVLVLALCCAATCQQQLVSIPPAAQDQPPVVKFTNFVVGGSGWVDQETVTGNAIVRVTSGTNIMFAGNASNPVGGVKDFGLQVQVNPPMVAHNSATPNTQGQVPVSLAILGMDGSGGIGSNAMQVTFSQGQIVALIGTAMNFNGQSTTATETVTVVPTVPNVIGQAWWQARNTLTTAGFASQCSYVDGSGCTNKEQDAKVQSQHPQAGNASPPGTVVTLYISY